MYKKFFLWLQIIATKNIDINILLYKKIKDYFNQDIYFLYDKQCLLEKALKKLKISQSIIDIFLDKNIKRNIDFIYNKIKVSQLEIITIEDWQFPQKIINNNSNMFCYITNFKINLNNKNIYLYFNDYYTKFARNLAEYFAKIINQENVNLITEYENKSINKIEILSLKSIKFDYYNKLDKCYIFLLDDKYINKFKLMLCDIFIIIEARYEEKIVKMVNYLVENSKDIYVVPSNIFRKNSYFSNYLIKQGADIILNKNDLKFILSKIIC